MGPKSLLLFGFFSLTFFTLAAGASFALYLLCQLHIVFFILFFKLLLLSWGHTLFKLLIIVLHYMPFFLTIEAFLALSFESDFLAYFLLAAAKVFIPCLSFGFMQPQVAHITFSSFLGRLDQILQSCHLRLHQVYVAYLLKVFSYQTF